MGRKALYWFPKGLSLQCETDLCNLLQRKNRIVCFKRKGLFDINTGYGINSMVIMYKTNNQNVVNGVGKKYSV